MRRPNIVDLHDDIVVAACFRDADRSIGERRNPVVIGACEENRDSYAQGKPNVGQIAILFQRGQHATDQLVSFGIAALKVRKFRAPHLDA